MTVISQGSEKETIGSIEQTNRVQIKLLKNHEIENSCKPKNFERSCYTQSKGWRISQGANPCVCQLLSHAVSSQMKVIDASSNTALNQHVEKFY